jgi:hypothetical protein
MLCLCLFSTPFVRFISSVGIIVDSFSCSWQFVHFPVTLTATNLQLVEGYLSSQNGVETVCIEETRQLNIVD